ncbi:putative DNA repair protein (Tof1) [Aspergillus clavatus NRRL 1]|uniref:Topoisomerase 1-associated factor 1 n=1 Tax=Aspergillus clavatus (strain ATCC 1007 / CBS 513.65 / DSM 816 / NCTC 3887 / NRRL 1 / QM 1276 / 107) TaxID=344612 RepID=TOF1_ASPCL|nr:mating-type switching protein swi1 [Aspergillus clavatus NRRL 1]A1C928.1 RecName: Full=Topoisomerase 1-associated factor 1 [Aspergillus clavatus NRRL 1]EAW13352.1 mating-type switching protein swi1 [Aspergillus clavatus NRRL 1]
MDDEGAPLSESAQVVDPDVRAHVYSLVTALGGFNGENADRYVLGDDALACLRDIKRWLKLHDEKNNRMDVARCLGEANLVNGDLLPILTLWSTSGQNSKFMSRIALACLELLVPLTWPLELHSEMTVNHHRHTPYLQQAQVLYKRGILGPGGSSLLRTIIRIGLPSMAVPRSDRTTRDEGILKLMLYLLRNIAVISPHSRLSAEGDEEETSRSATINAFQDQDAFALLLTMCSNVADDFNLQDVVLLEILFHIVKGVNVEKLFMNDTQRKAKRTEELGDLLQKESSLRREYAKNAPTRHGRFGTMIWVKRDDAKVSTVSGQDVLKDSQTTLYKMDQSKKWNKPQVRRRQTEVTVNNDFNTPVNLNSTATKNLRIFIEEFLDSGFNPLFTHVRKAIEREADRIMDINSRHYFYTVAWFLEAERVRRKYQRERHSQEDKSLKKMEPDSFALVASVLNQETFVFLNRSMQKSFDNKEVEDLTAEMRCFTQILLTVQEMAQSPLDDDQEVADNIQNRIFYEETTHDRIISIIRGYKDQGFGYLDACTQLAHVFLRMLEHYSKENVDMQIRSRRRIKRKAKQDDQAIDVEDEEHASEDEELMEAERVSKERKFDFKRFAAKFCNQKCVDTFVAFIKYYKELNTDQLKRAHRYFYRIAFKQEMSVLLFRLDIINLFYRMIKGPGALDSSKPIFKEWEELVRQILRRMIKKIDQRPALITELLFSKINSTVFYLEFGFEKQTISVSKRPPAELEVDPREAKTTDEKLSIVVRVMIKDEHINLVKWISEVLRLAADERESWESREQQPGEPTAPNPMIPVKPDDEACQKAMFSNAKLRLLMTLIGFERLGMEDVPGASWVVPSSFTSDDLRHTKRVIDQCLIEPATEDPDQDLSRLIRRKYANDARGGGRDEQNLDIDFGSDSEGEDNVPDGPLFPPNHRSKANALDQLKKQRQKRRKEDGDRETPDDEVLEERRRARLENALARQAKIKSDLYIHASDEESDEEADEEFFRLEEQRRKEQAARIKHALLHGVVEEISDKSSKKTGRKRQSDQHTTLNIDAHTKRQRRKNRTDKLDEGDDLVMAGTEAQSPDSPGLGSSSHDAKGIENTPLTSDEDELEFDDDLAFSRDRNRRKDFTPNVDKMVIEPAQQDADPAAPDEDDDEDAPVVGSSRRRVRGGFVIESDSE